MELNLSGSDDIPTTEFEISMFHDRYKARFGETFDFYQVQTSGDAKLWAKVGRGMHKAMQTGKPLTDKDLGITPVTDPSLDL